jgi:integrase/recombinase XerD
MTDKAINPLRQRLIDDMAIRRLGPKTQHEYIRRVKGFADFLGRSPAKATADDVHRYQLRLASIGATVSTVNATASALRFFFKVTLKRSDLADEVVSVREPRRLPVVLSPEEVGRLLAATTNVKQKAALSLTYATGLRASEVISLKLTDIDRDRMVIRVEQGKSLPSRRRGARRIGMSSSRPTFSSCCANGGASRARRDGCLPASPGCFPATAGSNISARHLHRLVRMAAARAGITKRVGVHTLRHSFATHLLEQKTDIRVIQVLLGHKKLDTTALYTRVAISAIGEVTSPLDLLLKMPG